MHMHAVHSGANKRSSQLVRGLKLELYISNVVGKGERGEKALVGRTKGFFRKDKWAFRTTKGYKKVSIVFVYTGEWSFLLLQGFMIALFLFFFLEVNLPLGGNFWQTHVQGVADFRQVREFREVFFLHLLNRQCPQLKIIFLPTLGFPGFH